VKRSSFLRMKTGRIAVLLGAAFLTTAQAQRGEPEVPMMRPEEARAIQDQAARFFDAIRPVAEGARPSTVWIWVDTGRGRRPVGFGTVVGDGSKVLTKWSEIAMAQGTILAVGFDNTSAKATVSGVYRDEDLALLQIDGLKFKPAVFATGEAPKLGRMLIAASPDDLPAGVGVVAVEARSLREKDQAFLGVGLDNTYKGSGVKIRAVEPASGASDAGLKSGDVILSIGGRAVNSLFEMRNALTGFGPGETVEIRYARKGAEQSVKAELKEKPEFEGFPNGRLRQMERMGTRLSLVRSGFPSAIQTDMQLERDRCGGPVVDLDGKVVGIAIARADRTRSFILPAAHILKVLGDDPMSEDAARAAIAAGDEERKQVARNDDEAPDQPTPRVIPLKQGSADRLRRHLEDMDRLMERMKEEMEGIEE
jgi:S1-C subfamily serine protease